MAANYSTIMVPLDGSKSAENALDKAINVAINNDATLILAHVVDFQFAYRSNIFENNMREKILDKAKNLLADYEKIVLSNQHTKVTKIITEGIPKAEIANSLVKKYNIDLIIMGATGLSAIEKFFIGSTTEYVTRNAHCDVLIVRNKARLSRLPEGFGI